MNWYHVVKFYTVRIPEGSLKYPIPFINSIPMRKLKYSKQKVIPEIADQILTTQKFNPQADATALETEIDQLVYVLYDLTEEGIAIVEESIG